MGYRDPKSQPLKWSSRDQALSADELDRLLKAAKSPIQRLYLRLMGVWALRSDEAAHLTLDWLSGTAGTLSVPRRCGCAHCREKGKLWMAKRAASARTLPIREKDPATWALLAEVFGKGGRKPVSTSYLRQLVYGVADRAGFLDRPVSPHRLRGTAAIAWAKKGLSSYEIAALLGHGDTRSAESYIRISGIDVRAALSRVDLPVV